MAVRIIATNQRVTAFLDGEIDHHNVSAIRTQIDDAIQQKKPRILKLDYGDVTFMDSSGIGLVMGRYRILQPLGGEIVVSNLSYRFFKVMQLAGIERIAKINMRENKDNADNK